MNSESRGQLRLLGQSVWETPQGTEWRLERKVAACLAYLAIEGPTYRSTLAGLLWPDSPESTARNNLSQLLRKIRLNGGVDLLGGGDPLQLPDDLGIDVRTARDLYTQGKYDELVTFGGEVLNGQSYDDCPELDDWVRVQRERWLDWRLLALREDSDRLTQEGELTLAVTRLTTLLELDPVSEDAWRQLMRLHYLRGDRAAALKAYARCEEVLRSEFGSTPLPQTQALALEIQRNQVTPTLTVKRRELPVALLRPPQLVGREREWAQLEDAWARGTRFTFLRGAPGSGKTRLAVDFVASKGLGLLMGGRPGDRHVPWASIARNVRTVLTEMPPVPVDAWVLRELSRIVPEFAVPGEPPLPPLASEAEVQRFQLAEQIFFTVRQPGVIATIIDDWQFTDDLTNRDGQIMWTSPPPEGLDRQLPQMLVTFRTDELEPSSQAVMEAIVQGGLGVIIDVPPLGAADLGLLMNDIGVTDDPASRERLVEYTGGNPLFLLETVKHLFESGELDGPLPEKLPLPEKVWELIERRLNRLSAPALAAARAAAVLQRDFDVSMVAEVLGAPVLEVAQHWSELEAAQIVRGNRFWHDIVYEAVARDTPAAMTQILHRSAARVLRRLGAMPTRVAQHWLEGGSPAEAIPSLQVAEAYAQANFLPDLAQVYRERRQTLEREYGVEATPEPSPQPAGQWTLPITRPGFYGRNAEQAALREALTGAAGPPLVSLIGPGGVGKSRLAIEVGREVQEDFPNGVAFVSLADVPDAEGVLPAVARTLGLAEGGGDVTAQLRAFLAPRRMLLILDNFEHLLDAAADVTALLRHAPQVRALVTSRAPLHVSGERLHALEPLDLSGGQSPAVQLLVQRAREVRPEFAINAENHQTLHGIAGRLDGLPLALELAAARLRVLSPGALLARLERALPLLTGGVRDLPERQQTLRAAVAWSDHLLPDPDRRLFRLLAVFQGGWTLEAAEALSGSLNQLDVLESLSALIDHNLVRVQEVPGGEPRYGMLSTIQEYGREQLEASGDLTDARARHAALYLEASRQARAALSSPAQARWVRDLETDEANFRAASADLLARGELDAAAELAWNLALHRWMLGTLPQGAAQVRDLLAHPLAGTMGPRARARALGTQGLLTFWQAGDESRRALDEAARLFSQEAEGEAQVQCELFGVLHLLHQGRVPEAEARLAVIQLDPNAFTQAMALGVRAALDRHQGNVTGAREGHLAVLALTEPRGDALHACAARIALAEEALQRGNALEAAQHVDVAYMHALDLGCRTSLLSALGLYVQLLGHQGPAAVVAPLVGAFQAQRQALGLPGVQTTVSGVQAVDAALIAQMGGSEYAAHRVRGEQLDLGAALDQARQALTRLRDARGEVQVR